MKSWNLGFIHKGRIASLETILIQFKENPLISAWG
jgi:hypothetical protein